MFCIVYENQKYKRKNLIKFENGSYEFYTLCCKKLSERIRRRIQNKLSCPIVFANESNTSDLQMLIQENIVFYLVKKFVGQQVAIVKNPEPDRIIQRILPYCKEIHLIDSAAIDEQAYLRRYGYAPAQFNQYQSDTIIIKYDTKRLYFNGKEIYVEENGYILPENVVEMLPQDISELEFIFLLWKYCGFDIKDVLPGNVIYYQM